MAIVTCRSCRRNVLPRSDDTCPNCHQPTAGSPDVPPLTDEQLAKAAEWDRFRAEEKARRGEAQRERSLGVALIAGGGAIAIVAIAFTVGSYVWTGGASFYMWTGGVVVGVGLAVRGWSRLDRSRRLLQG